MSKPKKKPSKRQSALAIIKVLREKGFQAYFVGGCVRDMVMKRRPSDFDIATSAFPEEIEAIFSKTIPVGKAFGVMIVRLEGESFEVATFRKDFEYRDGRRPGRVEFSNAKADCLRRDFTVNGLFYDPAQGEIIDWVDGIRDIKRKVIRTIGSPTRRFREDKLRMLRAVRFATNLGFKIEKKTLEAIKRMHKQTRVVSAERIRDELVKLLTGPNPRNGLDWLDKTGLLKVILPEVEKLKNVAQPKEFHPEGDVYKHTRLLLYYLKEPDIVLALGALLHDIGKPKTFRRAKDRIRFNGHDKVGARMTEDILQRLRFSNEIKKQVTACVEWHMQFKDAKKMRESTLKKMFQRPTFDTELEQHRVDCMASHKDLTIWRFLHKKKKTMTQKEIKPTPYLMGRDLLAMGIPAGPAMGEILKLAEEKQLDGHWKNKEEAAQWAKKHWRILKRSM